MYTPSLKEFLQLSKQYNIIPVYKQINADLDTPVSSFLKIKKDAYAFLLESVEGQENIARFSFLGSNPCLVFQSKGRNISVEYRGAGKNQINNFGATQKAREQYVTATDPLDEIKKIMKDFRAADIKGLPRFYGGFVGYIGYDMVRFFEEIPDKNPDDLGVPDCIFILTDTLLVFDHVNHTIKIVSNIILPQGAGKLSLNEKERIYCRAIKNIESISDDFKKTLKVERKERSPARAITIESNFKKSEFCGIVNKAKEYIRKGDIIQVVLSQRFKARISKGPFDIYRDLRSLNPSPYMFFLKLNTVTLIGSSPEMLVRCEDKYVETRPIAGTRRRGKSESEDVLLEKELLADAKEKAEHIMLVDLGRNDLGRVCQQGKVKVNTFMAVERYSHVMHLVSDVSGQLQKGKDVYDALRACFPAGTVSGSPKIRAMEIVDELENAKRATYAGAVGYFSFSHNMDTCITIRTILVKNGVAYVQAGAGIVADSIPEREYMESVNKAKVLLEALRC
ncbi:MAG: anthranilate synthase component I [Candidatus Omnitrophota bacterium]|jgi:anthranilate synthase component 1